ncbi:adenylate isopentenyltransferase 5, chloroplastic-like [Actinidia eriantha]|uniref:adenylate isopentenyltransferase 5, chloroplastic-like n=1 Tax=Actinidia eriantha TaxID=165200 RepID=UPI00258CD3FB|nr:adenylate isopentenyltransferase 5, chloroplastic-like [Actinidia eriantha]
MRISFSACKQAPPPLVSFTGGRNMDPFIPRRRKDKVVVVVGATGTGKSRLSIDLATRIPAEIINSDKMQVYKGLDIVTNKVTDEECRGVPHHLLGIIDPNADFTAVDFCHHASIAIESIVRRDRLPIIAGGSNSFIRALVNDDIEFQSNYECCLLWVDVSLSVLHPFVTERVDQMVKAGLVNEVREMFDPEADYTCGIRRAIGVPEMDQFLRAESKVDDETRGMLLREAIEKIKSNTCKLACCQMQNILRLQNQFEWKCTASMPLEAFLKCGRDANEAWEKLVARPSTAIVDRFLYEDSYLPTIAAPTSISTVAAASIIGASTTTATAIAAATR